MTVAPKSGRGNSRSAFAAFIGAPQLWQNAFSSLTDVPHLEQLTIDLIAPAVAARTTSRLLPLRRRI
jgi:hypothetical protein